MLPTLEDLVRIVKKRKVFKRNKKSLEVKILATLLYFFGAFFEEDELIYVFVFI